MIEIVSDSEDERVREQKMRNMGKKEKKRLTRSLIEVERATMDYGNAPTKIKRKADKAIAEFNWFLCGVVPYCAHMVIGPGPLQRRQRH